ncbi:MAG: diguanylate cyclase [Pseudolysinimonas sp.]|uniref:GGDEF domain-containing protein n=1 Tax=Pseudolysinimonas sp. TaxID=2680009 RepID=UPI0032646EF6
MSPFDVPTLYVVTTLVTLAAGAAFLLQTMLRRNDAAGRLWSVAFICSIFAAFASLIATSSDQNWWAFAIGNGFYVTGTGLIWAGARVANRRRSMLPVVVLAGVFVAIVRVMSGTDGVLHSGLATTYLGAGVFLALAAIEFASRDLRKVALGPFLAVALSLASAFYAARSVTSLAIGPDDPAYQALFGPATSSLLEIGAAVVGTLALSSIQSDRFKVSEQIDAEFGQRVAIDGVLQPLTFREVAESWLMRAIRERITLVMLMIDIADLDEVVIAFGRSAGDAAVRATGRVTLLHAPTSSVIGRLASQRFVMLMELPTTDSVEAIADNIRDAVLATQLDSRDRFQVAIFHGIATTRESGARYDDLLRAAADAVAVNAAEAHARADEHTI